MNEIIEKLSSYNIFNYLFPGIVFIVFLEQVTSYKVPTTQIFENAFLYYFVGLILSRISSLIIEPFLKWTKFVKFAPYKDYVQMSQQDKTLETLSEANNMYRSMISVFFVLVVCKAYELLSFKIGFFEKYAVEILTVSLFTLFIFSYKKQTAYIRKRVEANKEKTP